MRRGGDGTGRRRSARPGGHWPRSHGTARDRYRSALVPECRPQLRRAPRPASRQPHGPRLLDRAWTTTQLDVRGALRRRVPRRARTAIARGLQGRSCRGIDAERRRDGDRDDCHGRPRRGLDVVLARLRLQGRAGSLWSGGAESADLRRRLPVRRTCHPDARTGTRAVRGTAISAAPRRRARSRCRTVAGRHRQGDRLASAWRRCCARHAAGHARSVRSSAVHHVFVRHDGTAEVHGARTWWNAAPAPQGARTAR